ncbi:hypothetical protein C8F01DRAFT_285306 [Mycena amicta]|nr:hypothetical protein C8F01DRAFT_285306 [Mycena amicta]
MDDGKPPPASETGDSSDDGGGTVGNEGGGRGDTEDEPKGGGGGVRVSSEDLPVLAGTATMDDGKPPPASETGDSSDDGGGAVGNEGGRRGDTENEPKGGGGGVGVSSEDLPALAGTATMDDGKPPPASETGDSSDDGGRDGGAVGKEGGDEPKGEGEGGRVSNEDLPALAGTAAMDDGKPPSPVDPSRDHSTLVVNDIDNRDIVLPIEKCLSWEALRYQLSENKVQALAYVTSGKFILRLVDGRDYDDDDNWKSKTNWDEWANGLAPFDQGVRVALSLWIVQLHCQCHPRPVSYKDGFCETCRMRCVENDEDELFNSPPAPDVPSNNSTPGVTGSGVQVAQDTVAVTSSVSKPTVVPPERSVVQVLRHRRPGRGTARSSSPSPIQDVSESTHPAGYPPPQSNVNNHQRRRQTAWASLRLGNFFAQTWNYVIIVYVSMTALGVQQGVKWDAPRLKRRASMLLNTFLVIDGGLLAFVVACLALSDVASSPVPRAFLILVAIFAVFACGASVYLSYKISDCEVEFSEWFIHHKNLVHTPGSLWDLETMIALPSMWTAWAFLNLALFAISFIGQTFTSYVGNENATTIPKFTLVQFIIWALAFLWSSVYSFRIYLQMREFEGVVRRRTQPERRNTAQVEHC